jgi:hypothetical protein
MTQALNLGLLGNFVNASGQVTLTTGVTGTLPVSNGGIGAATLAANNVLLGNGTSALQTVAPGTNGNVLQSNGTTWISSTVPAPTTAGVLSATAGATAGAVGTYVNGAISAPNGITYTFGNNYAAGGAVNQVSLLSVLWLTTKGTAAATPFSGSTALSGTWKYLGGTGVGTSGQTFLQAIFLRVA